MIKNWVIPYLILFFPALIFAQKQSPDFVEKKDSLLPGTSTSISFTIENPGSEVKIYTAYVETSSLHIIPIASKSEFSIPAKERSVYIAPLRIATETPQGKYTITLQLMEKNTDIVLTKSSEVTVLGSRKLSLTLLDSPEFIKAGETITANFLLKNSGNVTENITLESKTASVNGNSVISIPSGETKIVTVSKITNPELGKNEFQNLDLSAYSSDKDRQTVYASVKIIPVKPIEEDIYHRFPASASLSFVGMRNRGIYNDGFQGEIYGKGSLSEENKDILEFRAVTRNPVEFNSFTQYEEYFINYKRNHFFIHLGDKTYSSSFLTEFARYGRGAEVRFDLKKFSFGGFYNHPRFFRDIRDEFNVYSQLKMGKESEITAGYLHKIPRKNEDFLNFSNVILDSPAHIPYLKGKFQLNKNFSISGELAYSKTDLTEGNAYLIQAQGSFEKVTGNIMFMRASPHFSGYFTNTNTLNGNIQYKLSKKINILANYIEDARNFQRDTLYLSAPYRKFFQYGISYRYLKNGLLTFYNGFQKYEDRLEPKQFDYYEKFFKINLDQQLGIFQLNLQSQFGKTENYLTGFSGNSSFYTANISFEKLKTSFNLYGSYAITSRYQMQNQKQIYYGGRIISRFSEKTYFSLFYQNNYIPEEYFNDRNLFEALFHQQLFPGHELDVSGRYTLQRGELGDKDFIFSLRYTLRLNVPVKKIAEYTTLSGNIKNLGVKKAHGVRLILGNHLSVTDKNGDFLFKNIIPGEYLLEIDRSTIEIDDIPDVVLPATVNLIKKENVFNFGLTTAANIQGNIQLIGPKENLLSFAQFPKNDKRKKDNVIIEVSNKEQTYRKMCIIGENFDFTYLRPGNWTVKIYRNGLDKRYKIAMDTFQLILNPSETKRIVINIIKQQTEIKYQQEPVKVGYNEIKKLK
ncbi:hypothetical protein CHRYSEOSP005_21710 [Chryseobacterium sp. Alg-005]|uniref:COG1470 family protein n=1 Tax=Chryseobacterium sp. Alg-005 TaxID=3159516 RepID=UPI0035558681